MIFTFLQRYLTQYKIYNGFLMKSLLIILPFVFTTVISAQDIQVTPVSETANHNTRTFSFDGATLQVSGNSITLSGPAGQEQISNTNAYSISGKRGYIGALLVDNELRVRLYDGQGKRVSDKQLDHFDPFDETLDIRVFSDGRFITRDNVANISLFDTRGELLFNVSNSSGSPDGEVASGIATDSSGNTIVLYNPRINFGANEGSRARILKSEDHLIDIYDNRERTIKSVLISKNGSYITMITERSGTDDEVIIFDRHGNRIAELNTDMELNGATLTENARYLTIYSSGRAQVYRVSDGELLGSTSFRVNVAYATYSPDDQQILALCGSISQNNQIRNPELHAIHLGERSIARTDISFPVSFLDHSMVTVDRTGNNQFMIRGLNRNLNLQTRF
jgi:hypothetical protein